MHSLRLQIPHCLWGCNWKSCSGTITTYFSSCH